MYREIRLQTFISIVITKKVYFHGRRSKCLLLFQRFSCIILVLVAVIQEPCWHQPEHCSSQTPRPAGVESTGRLVHGFATEKRNRPGRLYAGTPRTGRRNCAERGTQNRSVRPCDAGPWKAGWMPCAPRPGMEAETEREPPPSAGRQSPAHPATVSPRCQVSAQLFGDTRASTARTVAWTRPPLPGMKLTSARHLVARAAAFHFWQVRRDEKRGRLSVFRNGRAQKKHF